VLICSTAFILLTSLDQQAIETLLRLAEEYGGHSKDLATQSQGTVKGVHTDDSLKKAETNLKVFFRLPPESHSRADPP
jgi:hypothetical protein